MFHVTITCASRFAIAHLLSSGVGLITHCLKRIIQFAQNKMEDKTPEYKIILLGDPGVGKTTFFIRIREEEFVDTEQHPSASIGVDDLLYEHIVDGTKVKVSHRQASYL